MIRRYVLIMFLSLPVAYAIADGKVEPEVAITYENVRHAYARGETVGLMFKIVNNSSKAIKNAKLSMDIGGIVSQEAKLDEIEKGGITKHLFRVDTIVLKAGEYQIKCRLCSSGKNLAKAEFLFQVAPRWNPDRMPVWLWGVLSSDMKPETLKQMQWYADKGFDSPMISPGKGYFKTLDYVLCHGWFLTVPKLAGGFLDDIDDPAVKFKPRRPYSKIEEFTNPFNPVVAERQNEINRQKIKAVKDYPNLKFLWFNTEVEDFLPEEIPLARQYLEEPYGPTVEHKFLLPGVIANNDEGYVKQLYRYRWGDGQVVANDRAARMIHRYRPDTIVFTDPYRLAAIYDRFKGLDAISTWTYTEPDPKYMLYIETLIAAGKPANQGVIHTVTMLIYPGKIYPKDKGWILMGPDRLVETSWINLSRRPTALSIYLSSACNPFSKSPEQREPYQKYPKSFEALKSFTETVVKPYGPMIIKLERSKRRVAVLSSESSRVYSASPRLLGGYRNYQIYCFYTLLNMIHIPADVVLDETIVEYGLDDYDVLVLPKCDTLIKTVYDKILEFQKRGGLVISDQYLRAPIHDVVEFDFDFTYRTKVSAFAILQNKAYAEWDDHIDIDTAKLKEVQGVTALDDQKIMNSYAAKLRSGLKGKIAREVDCSSTTALLNILEKDGAKYLFIINDKRTYGDRVGQYKAILEKAVPQTVTITLNTWPHDKLYLYDVIDKKILSAKKKAGEYEFEVDLPAPGGKIIAMLPEKLAGVKIDVPGKMNTAERYLISVLLKDTNGNLLCGVQPLKVCITDPAGGVSEFSDYYAAQSGVLSLDFVPAINDTEGTWKIEVEELMSGTKQKASFEVMPARLGR